MHDPYNNFLISIVLLFPVVAVAVSYRFTMWLKTETKQAEVRQEEARGRRIIECTASSLIEELMDLVRNTGLLLSCEMADRSAMEAAEAAERKSLCNMALRVLSQLREEMEEAVCRVALEEEQHLLRGMLGFIVEEEVQRHEMKMREAKERAVIEIAHTVEEETTLRGCIVRDELTSVAPLHFVETQSRATLCVPRLEAAAAGLHVAVDEEVEPFGDHDLEESRLQSPATNSDWGDDWDRAHSPVDREPDPTPSATPSLNGSHDSHSHRRSNASRRDGTVGSASEDESLGHGDTPPYSRMSSTQVPHHPPPCAGRLPRRLLRVLMALVGVACAVTAANFDESWLLVVFDAYDYVLDNPAAVAMKGTLLYTCIVMLRAALSPEQTLWDETKDVLARRHRVLARRKRISQGLPPTFSGLIMIAVCAGFLYHIDEAMAADRQQGWLSNIMNSVVRTLFGENVTRFMVLGVSAVFTTPLAGYGLRTTLLGVTKLLEANEHMEEELKLQEAWAGVDILYKMQKTGQSDHRTEAALSSLLTGRANGMQPLQISSQPGRAPNPLLLN